MPRATKVPSYSLHKPSGRAVVKVPEDGKQRSIYLGDYGSDESRENYARVVADILAGRTVRPPVEIQGTPTLEPSITVGELAKRFEKHAAGYYRKNGKATSEVATIRCAMKFLTANHAELPAAEFSIGDLKAIRQTMIEAGICRDSINRHYVGRIRRAFRWAAAEELIPPSVPQALALLSGLKAGRSEAQERPPVKPADETIVKKALCELSPTVRAMVELQLETGMRPGEVCRVRPVDIDRSRDVWIYRPETHKTEHAGKQRIILIGPVGQRILAPFLLRAENEYCFRPDIHVAVPKANKRYRIDSYRQAVNRACDRAFPAPTGLAGTQLKAWRKQHRFFPNMLRHSFGIEVRREHDLELAQLLLRARFVADEVQRQMDAGSSQKNACIAANHALLKAHSIDLSVGTIRNYWLDHYPESQ